MGKLLKIGLALGGGGARGLAHIGVLCALEHEKIPVDFLVGTSMGALVASVYALTPQCDAVIERFQRYLDSEEFRRTNPEFLHEHDYEFTPTLEGIFHRFASFIKKGFFYSQSLAKKAPISEENFTRNIGFLVDDVAMEKTRIPLAVVSLDLKSGKEVVLKEGSLRKAVSASCAIPGILPPVSMGDRELVDGGWVNRVPVRPTREMGADLVIGVDVAEGLTDPGDLSKGLDIVLRTYDICQYTLSQWQLREADVVLRPDLSGLHWSDFGHFADCLRAGQDSVRKNLEEIKKVIRRKKIQKILLLPERFRPIL